jgi:hypothetical protein
VLGRPAAVAGRLFCAGPGANRKRSAAESARRPAGKGARAGSLVLLGRRLNSRRRTINRQLYLEGQMFHYPAVDSKGLAGSNDREIEITPEMIEAGVMELETFNADFEMEEDAVTRIFHAMWEKCRCCA